MNARILKSSHPDAGFLETRGVLNRPIWSKAVPRFCWHYESSETCYFPEGEVLVTPDGGTPPRRGVKAIGDVFAGRSCIREIRQAVRKHYRFD